MELPIAIPFAALGFAIGSYFALKMAGDRLDEARRVRVRADTKR
ncbi:MAG: hypothetical protein AAF638_05090 [Pseudomonadota bacterium]